MAVPVLSVGLDDVYGRAVCILGARLTLVVFLRHPALSLGARDAEGPIVVRRLSYDAIPDGHVDLQSRQRVFAEVDPHEAVVRRLEAADLGKLCGAVHHEQTDVARKERIALGRVRRGRPHHRRHRGIARSEGRSLAKRVDHLEADLRKRLAALVVDAFAGFLYLDRLRLRSTRVLYEPQDATGVGGDVGSEVDLRVAGPRAGAEVFIGSENAHSIQLPFAIEPQLVSFVMFRAAESERCRVAREDAAAALGTVVLELNAAQGDQGAVGLRSATVRCRVIAQVVNPTYTATLSIRSSQRCRIDAPPSVALLLLK